MGLGSLIFLGGVLLVYVADQGGADGAVAVGAVAGTVGAIWFLVGLIQLLTGAATSSEA